MVQVDFPRGALPDGKKCFAPLPRTVYLVIAPKGLLCRGVQESMLVSVWFIGLKKTTFLGTEQIDWGVPVIREIDCMMGGVGVNLKS